MPAKPCQTNGGHDGAPGATGGGRGLNRCLLFLLVAAFAVAQPSRAGAGDAPPSNAAYARQLAGQPVPAPTRWVEILTPSQALRPPGSAPPPWSAVPAPAPAPPAPGPAQAGWSTIPVPTPTPRPRVAGVAPPAEPGPPTGGDGKQALGEPGIGALDADRSRANRIRPYAAGRVGFVWLNDTETPSGVALESPANEPLMGGAIGVDWGRHWSAELAVDSTESFFTAPTERGKVAEYAIWTALGLLRFRYPILDDRLTPYALVGAGLGIGELNDRGVTKRDFRLSAPLDTTFVGALGGGFDFLLVDNIALTAELQHRFLYDTEIQVDGIAQDLDFNALTVSGGLRVYLDRGESDAGAGPADDDAIRGYLMWGLSAAVFTNPDNGIGVTVDRLTGAFSAILGANLTRYWGLELTVDAAETGLNAPEVGKVGEFQFVSGVGQLRFRYPIWDGRLTPYLVGGGGLGYGEFNDREVLVFFFNIGGDRDYTPVGVAGGGLGYFLSDNVAIDVNARYLFGARPELEIDGRTRALDLDMVLLSLGLRLHFP